jgi:DNA-binding MarR family transcriptional regulator
LIARLAGTEDRRAVIVITSPAGHAAFESLLTSTAPPIQQFATALFPS